MSLPRKVLAGVVLAAVVAVAVGAGVWYFVIRNDSPAPVSLQSALESVSTPAATATAGTSSTPTGADTSSTPTGSDTSTGGDLTGSWSVVQGDNSFVGYRVNETLANIGAQTAVGRTSNIEGSLQYDGSAITSVDITADLTTLKSDKSQRDGQLRTQAIETNKFPTATFKLSDPIEIGDVPADGASVTKTVSGQLTLHGVTKDVSIDIQGALQNGQLVVVGSTTIQFADYDVSQPVSFNVVSIDDHGVMEFQLVFQHDGNA